MKDFNFFDPYLNVSVKPDKTKLIFLFLVLAVLIVLVFLQVNLIISTQIVKSDIEDIDLFISSSDTISKLGDYQAKSELKENLTNTLAGIKQINSEIEASDFLDKSIIEEINSELPDNVFVSNMRIDTQLVDISGYSSSHEGIAQLAYNLRMTGRYSDVQVSNIVGNEENYSFKLTAFFVEAVQNEN
jgi:type IV pilus assembly protein PilN